MHQLEVPGSNFDLPLVPMTRPLRDTPHFGPLAYQFLGIQVVISLSLSLLILLHTTAGYGLLLVVAMIYGQSG